ncbi:MAG: hypothetical protein ACFFG0_30635 [Candidatus Thorarchaeota archaeon]
MSKTNKQEQTYINKIDSLLWQHGWWIFLLLSLLVWCIYAFKYCPHNFGIPTDTFISISIGLITILGILLGLLIAAIVFIIQNAIFKWRESRDKLIRELEWLDKFIKNDDLEIEDAKIKIEEILKNIGNPSTVFRGTLKNTISLYNATCEILKSIEHEYSKIGEELDSVKKTKITEENNIQHVNTSGTNANEKNNDSIDNNFKNRMDRKFDSLYKLQIHMGSLAAIDYDIAISDLSVDFARMFLFTVLTTGIGLVCILTFMLIGAIEFAGTEFFSGITRFSFIGVEVWIVMANLLWSYKSLTFYIKTVRHEIPEDVVTLS